MIDSFDFGNISYLPEAKAIIMQESSSDMLTDPVSTITLDKYKVVPWGESNNLPAEVLAKISKSDAVASNLDHNIKMMYGQGVKPFLRTIENGKPILTECEDPRVLEFYENNDIPGYFLEQCADMATFYNTFPEIILTRDLQSVYSLRHKEATFSRWGEKDKSTGEIIRHFYSSKWEAWATIDNTFVSEVLNRNNPLGDLQNRIKNRKISTPRFMMQINFPTPGREYYQKPPFWSIFASGSYDFSSMIWNFKKALLKNGLAVRYVIYVSDKYWDLIFREEKIETSNAEKIKERKQEEFTKWRNFLSDEKNYGKGLMALKKIIPSGSTAFEEKYIEFVELKNSLKGGEYLEDSSEVNNTINYAMQVHSSLIGNNPGKTNGSMSGTDKRELFHIKAAMMTPYRDRLYRPLYVASRFNKFPQNLVWNVVDFEFTTLDNNKSGKQQGVTNENQPQP